VKQDSNEAQNFKRLLERLDPKYRPEDPPASDPVTQLVIGFLQWETTRKQAETAFQKLMSQLVDINELRVTDDLELLKIIGANYSRGEERLARLREALNAIFVREHAVAMESIRDKSKKEQRAYLESLPGMPPYVIAQVMLLSFGGHALPVDEKLVSLLAQEEILSSDTTPAQAESSLLRQVKASEAVHVHMLLQAWADDSKTASKGRTAKQGKKTGKTASKSSSQSKSAGRSKTSSGSKSAGSKTASGKGGSGSKKTTRKTSSSRNRK
jgi:endonuclease III